MHSTISIVVLLLVHSALLFAAVLTGNRRNRSLSLGKFLFCAGIPIFGGICALELVNSSDPDPTLLQEMVMKHDSLRRYYAGPSQEAATAAPMEEAFLLNEPRIRREMMMKLLHDDPQKNLELLMIARFNDDPETAHYATATLTEYQRQTELALQQSQAILAKQPDNMEERLHYIRQMEDYIDSGLLEGHLLNRQKLLLEKEISLVPEDNIDLPLGCLKVKNLLSVSKAVEATEAAHMLIRKYPREEAPWLELMRVYVNTQNRNGLTDLKKQLEKANVMWTYNGREKAAYFMKGIE